MSKNSSLLFLLIIIIFLISRSNSFVTKVSKEKVKRVREVKNTTNIEEEQEDYFDDYPNDFGGYSSERNEFISKMNKVFSKNKIKKDTILSKKKLQKVFLELFDDSIPKKNEEEMTEEELKNKEYYDNVLDETFIKLTEDYNDEEGYNYTTIKEMLDPDRIGRTMDEIFDLMPPMFDDGL